MIYEWGIGYLEESSLIQITLITMKFTLFQLFLFVAICNQGLAQANVGRITSYSISGERGSGYIGELVVSTESAPTNVISLINAQGTTVSTDDITGSAQLKVYPNPSNHEIFIESNKEIRFFEIYNALGQFISKGREGKIDISKLPPGHYQLSINGNSATRFIKL